MTFIRKAEERNYDELKEISESTGHELPGEGVAE